MNKRNVFLEKNKDQSAENKGNPVIHCETNNKSNLKGNENDI